MGIVIIEAPHADDEVFACGGTISVLARDGWQIVVRIWTDAGGKKRERQLRDALEILRVPRPHIIRVPGGRDTALHERPRGPAVAEAAALYAKLKPQMVFCPFYEDTHQDHRTVSRICQSGLRRHCGMDVFMYEVPSSTESAFTTFTPNYYVDISGEHLTQKFQAAHAYGMELLPPPASRSLRSIEALATVRGAVCGCVAAEGFVQIRGRYRRVEAELSAAAERGSI
jgi:LmbE family N-acetylglucosaminyl deacetylase